MAKVNDQQYQNRPRRGGRVATLALLTLGLGGVGAGLVKCQPATKERIASGTSVGDLGQLNLPAAKASTFDVLWGRAYLTKRLETQFGKLDQAARVVKELPLESWVAGTPADSAIKSLIEVAKETIATVKVEEARVPGFGKDFPGAADLVLRLETFCAVYKGPSADVLQWVDGILEQVFLVRGPLHINSGIGAEYNLISTVESTMLTVVGELEGARKNFENNLKTLLAAAKSEKEDRWRSREGPSFLVNYPGLREQYKAFIDSGVRYCNAVDTASHVFSPFAGVNVFTTLRSALGDFRGDNLKLAELEWAKVNFSDFGRILEDLLLQRMKAISPEPTPAESSVAQSDLGFIAAYKTGLDYLPGSMCRDTNRSISRVSERWMLAPLEIAKLRHSLAQLRSFLDLSITPAAICLGEPRSIVVNVVGLSGVKIKPGLIEKTGWHEVNSVSARLDWLVSEVLVQLSDSVLNEGGTGKLGGLLDSIRRISASDVLVKHQAEARVLGAEPGRSNVSGVGNNVEVVRLSKADEPSIQSRFRISDSIDQSFRISDSLDSTFRNYTLREVISGYDLLAQSSHTIVRSGDLRRATILNNSIGRDLSNLQVPELSRQVFDAVKARKFPDYVRKESELETYRAAQVRHEQHMRKLEAQQREIIGKKFGRSKSRGR